MGSKRDKRKKDKREAARKASRPKRIEVPVAPAPYAGRAVPLERIDGARWRIPRAGLMHVDGIVYADETLLPDLPRGPQPRAGRERRDASPASSATPWPCPTSTGATASRSAASPPSIPARGGVVSPGGVGYDINCGVRLLASDLALDATCSRSSRS